MTEKEVKSQVIHPSIHPIVLEENKMTNSPLKRCDTGEKVPSLRYTDTISWTQDHQNCQFTGDKSKDNHSREISP